MTHQRMTWRRISTQFASYLRMSICADHSDYCGPCPFCRDTAAVKVFEAKRSGKLPDTSWKDIATVLAVRFQYFVDCGTHTAANADPEGCPFCADRATWDEYVAFSRRRGVRPIDRFADAIPSGPSVTWDQIPITAPHGD